MSEKNSESDGMCDATDANFSPSLGALLDVFFCLRSTRERKKKKKCRERNSLLSWKFPPKSGHITFNMGGSVGWVTHGSRLMKLHSWVGCGFEIWAPFARDLTIASGKHMKSFETSRKPATQWKSLEEILKRSRHKPTFHAIDSSLKSSLSDFESQWLKRTRMLNEEDFSSLSLPYPPGLVLETKNLRTLKPLVIRLKSPCDVICQFHPKSFSLFDFERDRQKRRKIIGEQASFTSPPLHQKNLH